MKRLVFSKDAVRTLSRMPVQTAALIRSKIAQYAAEPAAQANNVRALKGMAGVSRLRVGDWRVLFMETGEIVAIVKVAPRGGAYK